MLTELCQELRNWFERKQLFGTFTIESGQIAVPNGALQDGQYFRIVGSVFNDGVHQYSADSTDLQDEVFKGAVWTMAIPPTVIDLSDKIDAWEAKYGGVNSTLLSPYDSESFGGYSYSKSSGRGTSGSGGGSSVPTWKSVFADELNRWRKI